MKKALFYLFITTIIVVSASISSQAQDTKARKQVITSGGMVGAVAGDVKMSGAFGQAIIGKKVFLNIEEVEGAIVHQGFWVPEGILTSVEEPNFSYNSRISNYPNPVNNVTTLKYELESNAFVTLKVSDMIGNQITVFQDVYQSAGEQSYQWYARNPNGMELTSGSYIYELSIQPAERTGVSSSSPVSLRNVMVIVK